MSHQNQRQTLFFAIILTLLSLVCLSGRTFAGRVLNDALVNNPFSHRVWQDVIESAVDPAGNVDFIKLRARPGRLNKYLAQLAFASPENQPGYFRNRNDELAYWINAYNALALRQILDRYPVDSLNRAPDFDTMARYELGGKVYSLAQIRAKIESRFRDQPLALSALTQYTRDTPPLAHAVFEGPSLTRQIRNHASRQLSSLTTGQGSCPELPHWLESAEPALFLAERYRDIGNPTSDWNRILRPLLPETDRGEFDCPAEPRFAGADRRLRQIP